MGLDILEEIKKSSIELKNLEDEVSIKETRIKLLGNRLLKYLRTLPGWENLIIHLPSAYMKNPNLIFTRGFIYQCSVYCDQDSIYWENGYSDGTDYIIFCIRLNESLETQIEKAMREKAKKEEEKDFAEFNKDLETYYAIKKKYNL